MTRREEIVKATKECREDYLGLGDLNPEDIADAFEKGAYWADKTMIEKIRIWVTERYDLDYMGDFKDLLDYLKSLKEEQK